jgi:hypothetical protein
MPLGGGRSRRIFSQTGSRLCDLILRHARGQLHIMESKSVDCVMSSILESHQATQFTAAREHSGTIS